MPPPPHIAARIVVRADMQIALNPNLLRLQTYVDHQPTHFMGTPPASIIGVREGNAWCRNGEGIATGGFHCVEDLLCSSLRNTA